MLLISSRPFSAQVLLAGGFGLGVAEVQAVDEATLEVDAVVVGQPVRIAVIVVVLVCFLSSVV